MDHRTTIRLQPNAQPSTGLESGALEAVQRALEGLRFGSVEITVHEGRIVQLDRHERIRLSK